MVFQRPPRPGQPPQQSDSHQQSRGNRLNPYGENPPSPWLLETEPDINPQASFVEYLRWMREPGGQYKDPTKVHLLHLAEQGANYSDRLKILTDRTRKIAGQQGVVFEAKCSWRIRVGGHRGPESILLPAFDALGIPFIPSSTLRGIARTQAIREQMQEGMTWKEADRAVAKWFGHLEAGKADQAGKVIFLDAYPLPKPSGARGGLTVDMANNIWSWSKGDPPPYNPNPNSFFSLKEPTFLIGLRSLPGYEEMLEQVKTWLIRGLQLGIGSQVNTGYGSFLVAGEKPPIKPFFSVDFSLEGQLIHGRQKFTSWNWNVRRNEWQIQSSPEAEVRSVAFKSMLRYWFRTFALGVLPIREVKSLEGQLFGAIDPQQQGWITIQIQQGRVVQQEARPVAQGKNDPCGEQKGKLCLFHSSAAPSQRHLEIQSLMESLTWMMFYLGGVGQGARRPCYSRQTRERAPWWRGSSLFPEESEFWELPDAVGDFQSLFRRRLDTFYTALAILGDRSLNPQQPLKVGQVKRSQWSEAVDANCTIVVCGGREDQNKPYALSVLHSRDLRTTNQQGQLEYDGNLCGQVQGIVKPSPVWIADLGDYQVVTIFGVTQHPRASFLQSLKGKTGRNNFSTIWPLNLN